ncbi:MAG: 23S rRNA (adenine(2503)-C(2))-methyltransferase RlmN [Sedimenticolaceae bacterium]
MSESPKTNLLGLTKADMEAYFVRLGAKAFHGRNVLKWIHKHGVADFDEMTDVPQRLRDQLKHEAEILVPRIALAQPAGDGTVKWVLELADGQHIETVYIPEGSRSTICVSSQVGCALDCSFCSTAQQGFNRNLSAAEIIGQVWLATRELGRPPTNVVMMGMGEPLANFDNVVPAMELMQEDLAYMISKVRVTISTSGIVPALERLREVSEVSLAVSLHAPDNALRDQLVPINRKYPLEQLIPACKRYVESDRRRKITWEYVMLDGVNDSIAHAKALIRLLEGVPSKVNLIPFNPFPGTVYRTSPADRVETFRQRLKRAGIMAMTRKTRGDDIDAACGQLVGKVNDRSRRHLKRIPIVQEHRP